MIRIENLNLRLGSFALQDINLSMRKGEYFVLLGKPGSGKTVLLECLCGLLRPQSGRILIADDDVTKAQPRDRKIGYVPQDYALFTVKTVRENIAFGLKLKRLSARRIRERVEELARLLGIEHLLERSVTSLSGGEKQRVALARCLAISPQVLLLDEPVSALDEVTRETVCMELKELQQATRTTTIHICHDFEEMLLMADRVAVIDEARILQVGTPEELLERPKNLAVARFLKAQNIFRGRAHMQDGTTRLAASGLTVLSAGEAEGEVSFIVRPEKLSLFVDGSGVDEENVFSGKVLRIIDKGPAVRVDVRVGGAIFVAIVGRKQFEALHLQETDGIGLSFSADAVYILKG